MTDSIIPLIMLAVFLTATLWLGLRYKKGSHSITEYTIGDKTFTTAALIATVLATNYGGGMLIRTVEMVYAGGLWYIMMMIGSVVMEYLSCIVVSHRVGVFIGHHAGAKSHISMADTMERIYGKIPGLITALATLCIVIVNVAGQITVLTKVLQICISDINPTILTLISASIVVLYSAFGGIQSVTITDVLQCATFTIIIPYIAYKVFRCTGMTISQIFETVSQTDKFQFRPILQNKVLKLSLITGLLAGVGVYPVEVQRMYMARNSQQAREAYVTATILDLAIMLIITFLGIATYAGYSHITDPNMIWPTIVSNSSPIFKGFFVVSLFTMAMSTADSCLNTASSMFAHDIITPLRKNGLTERQQLYLAKIACFIIGVFSIFLSLSVSKYKDSLLRLLYLAMDIGNPIFVAPFLLAVFGFRCKEKVAVLGMTVGGITIILWNKFIPRIDDYFFDSSFFSMLANGITMLLAHYSLPDRDRQSWQKPSLDYQQSQQARQRRFYR